jgi:hypothetical protein
MATKEAKRQNEVEQQCVREEILKAIPTGVQIENIIIALADVQISFCQLMRDGE